MSILIKNGTIVNSKKSFLSDIFIENNIIKQIAPKIDIEANEIIDAKGLHILPGIIDSQVHFRDPGLTHKEDLESGSLAALHGGVTTFLEMPNTKPSTTTAERIAEKVAIAKEKSHTRFGFFLGASADNLDQVKNAHNIEGCCGIKIFLGSSTGDLLLYDEDKLIPIFENAKVPIAVHSENEVMLKQRKYIQENATDVHAHYKWRDEQTAFSSTEKILEIARKTGKKVHILHISTAQEMQFLEKNKDVCTVEVTPQHLTLFAPECYDELDTFAQMNPPIREINHLKTLWWGIENKIVDVLGSDHAPHLIEEKKLGYPKSPSGMPGVQTMLPIMLNHVNNKKLTLNKLVELLCENPSDLYSLDRGKIQEQKVADITIIDLNKTHIIKNEDMKYKCGWTPFHGKEIKGKVEKVIIDGKIKL